MRRSQLSVGSGILGVGSVVGQRQSSLTMEAPYCVKFANQVQRLKAHSRNVSPPAASSEVPELSADPSANSLLFTPALIRKLVITVVLSVAMYSIWLIVADVGAIAKAIGQVELRAFLASLAFASANYVLRWARWHLYLNKLGMGVGKHESMLVFAAGFAMSVTPAKMGEVLKSLLLKHTHGTAVAKTAPIVVAERVTDLVGLVFLLALGSHRLPGGSAVLVVASMLTVAVLVVCSHAKVGNWFLRWSAKLPVVGRFAQRLEEAYEALLSISSPGIVVLATILSTGAWFSHCLSLFTLADAIVPVSLSILDSCVAYSLPLLAGTLVLIPGGLGATEASMTGLGLTLSGGQLTLAHSSALVLLTRLVTFWWAILLGFLALFAWRFAFQTRGQPSQTQ